MLVYRIYTERIAGTDAIVRRHFPSYTQYKTVGVWQREGERGVMYELVADVPDSDIVACAREIRRANKQQAVLVTKQLVDSVLITD